MTGTNELLLVDELSAVGQKRAALTNVSEEGLCALVRLNIALFGKLLIPDSDVYNGSLLLNLRPRRLIEIAGHTAERPTLVIRSRVPSMSESLRLTLSDVEQKRFHPLNLRTLLDDRLEVDIAMELARTSLPKKQDLAKTVKHLLAVARSVGASEDQVGRIESGWVTWAKFDDKTILRTWPNAPFALGSEMASHPLSAEQFESDGGRAAYRQVVEETEVQSRARYGTLTAALNDHTPSSEDAELLKAWYHDRRQVALKVQHGSMLSVRPSNYSAFLRATFGTDGTGYPSSMPVDEVTLDEHDSMALQKVSYRLAGLSAKEFQQLCKGTAGDRSDWLHGHDVRALRRLVERIGDAAGNNEVPAGLGSMTVEIINKMVPGLGGASAVGGFAKLLGAGTEEAAMTGAAGAVVVVGAVSAANVAAKAGLRSTTRDNRSVVRWARETQRVS